MSREAFERFLHDREQRKITYLVFNPDGYLDEVTLNQEEVAEYFKENIKTYEIPKKIKVDYLLFTGRNLIDKVSISPEEIQDQYEADIEKYNQPKEVHARHILFKVPEDADEETTAEVRKRAEEVLKLAKSGKDFAELAKEYSEGPSGPDGGDLGFFSEGTMVKPFEEAAFSMNPGEISDLVKTRFGFHIIKVDAIKEARTQTLDEVKGELEKELKEIQAGDMAAELSEEAYDMIMQGQDLKSVGKQLDGEFVETDFFSSTDKIEGLDDDREMIESVFSLEQGEISQVIEIKRKYVIFQVKDVQPPKDPELADVKDRVEHDWKMKKARDIAEEAARKFAADDKNWEGVSGKTEGGKYEVKESDLFTRNTPVPDIGYAPEVSKEAFTLTKEKPFLKKPVSHGGKVYLIRLTEIVPATKEEFDKEKETYVAGLLTRKKGATFTSWLEMVRSKADIKVLEKI